MQQRRTIFAVLALAAIGIAAADGLDVRTGLWEMTITIDARGTFMPKAALDKLTPEQRAKVAESLKQQAAQGPRTSSEKTCVTAQDLKEGAFQNQEDKEEGSCKYTPGTRTSTVQEGTMVCAGENARTGTFRVEAVGRDRIKGSYNGSGAGSRFSMQLSGKWLSASCAGADDD